MPVGGSMRVQPRRQETPGDFNRQASIEHRGARHTVNHTKWFSHPSYCVFRNTTQPTGKQYLFPLERPALSMVRYAARQYYSLPKCPLDCFTWATPNLPLRTARRDNPPQLSSRYYIEVPHGCNVPTSPTRLKCARSTPTRRMKFAGTCSIRVRAVSWNGVPAVALSFHGLQSG